MDAKPVYCKGLAWEFGGDWTGLESPVADMQGACSNHILTHLERWNKLLQSSSLARKKPENANEGEFEDAPSDHKPVVVRRRRKA